MFKNESFAVHCIKMIKKCNMVPSEKLSYSLPCSDVFCSVLMLCKQNFSHFSFFSGIISFTCPIQQSQQRWCRRLVSSLMAYSVDTSETSLTVLLHPSTFTATQGNHYEPPLQGVESQFVLEWQVPMTTPDPSRASSMSTPCQCTHRGSNAPPHMSPGDVQSSNRDCGTSGGRGRSWAIGADWCWAGTSWHCPPWWWAVTLHGKACVPCWLAVLLLPTFNVQIGVHGRSRTQHPTLFCEESH